MYCRLGTYLNTVWFDRRLEDSDGYKISTRKVFIFYEVKQKGYLEFVTKLESCIITECTLCQDLDIYVDLLYLLNLNKVLYGSSLL